MSYDDHVPDDDAIANRARHALHQMAGARTIGSSWADVQTAARRVQQKRLSMVGAAGAIVLIAATAAVAAVGRDDAHPTKGVGSESPATSTSQTTTSVPFFYGSSSAAPTTPAGPIAVPGTVAPTVPTQDTGPVVLQPQDGSWEASTSADAKQVSVGDTVTLHAELRNTGTQAQQTIGYGSLGIACDRPIGDPYTEGLPFGEFLDWVVLPPGESHSFSMSFRAEPEWVGSIICGVGLAFHGDAFAAGPFEYPAGTVTIDIVAAPEPSTSTTSDTVPTTATTTP